MSSSSSSSKSIEPLLLSWLHRDLLYLMLQCLDRKSRLQFLRVSHYTKGIVSHPLSWIKDKNVIDTLEAFDQINHLAASVCRWAPTHVDLRGRMPHLSQIVNNEPLLNLPTIRSICIDAQNTFYLDELCKHNKCNKVCYCWVLSCERKSECVCVCV